MNVSVLPALNASLNGVATVLLICGYVQIKRQKRAAHRNFMIAAFLTSVLFLVSYVIYHLNSTAVTRFNGPAAIRPLYYAMLITHIVLAAVVPPLCLITLQRAWTGQFAKHRRIARITFPVWLYVSITGVLIYVVLYVLFPASTGG